MSNQAFHSPEVLIVGAGPTGLVLAYELARRNIPIRIIDKNEGPAEQSRALLIQVRTLEVFHFMGIIDEIIQRGQKISQMNLFMRHHLAFEAHFQSLKSPYPFPLVLPQNDTEAILISALEKQGIQIERNTELLSLSQDSGQVTVTLRKNGQEENLCTSYLVGCDGAHSVVRHSLNLPFKGSAYSQLFSLADVEFQSSLKQDEMYLFFESKGFFAILPMRKGWVRLITVNPSSQVNSAPEPTLEDFQKCVDHFIPGKGKIIKTYWLSYFHLHHRVSPSYQEGRVFIAGDAAHIHSPAGGQGMNTGIQDSFNLAWKLALVIQKKSSPKLLESYSLERQPVGERVLKTTDRFFKAIVSQGLTARLLKNYLLPFAAKFIFPRIVQTIAYFVSQLQVNYRKSKIVSEAPGQHWPSQAPRPGERALDGDFKNSKTLFDTFEDPNYILLIFCEKENAASLLKSLQRKALTCLEIPKGPLYSLYGIEKEGLYLIRPDRYIAYRQQGLDLKKISNWSAFLE